MADIDYHLRNQVSQLTNLVNQLDQGLVAVSAQVTGVEATQRDTRDSLQKLRDDFQAFVRSSQLADALQRAETRIGVILDRIEHDFGHHKVVRRTTVGLLQAFDTGLVSEESVRSVSDELMIQTPRYWLAPALVALAAWSSDDRELCERAVTEAFRRSPGRTSLLFALILRRQNRQAAAVRWLLHYLRAQDPTALGREFAVILESVAQGAFGPVGRELLRTVLDEWLEVLLEGDQAVAAQVERWRAEVEAHRAMSAKEDFPRLAAVSPQWPALESVLGAAEAHRALLEKYTRLMSQENRLSHRVEDLVDDILDRLVSEYDNEELPLRRDLAYNEAVIAHDGDTAAARKAADADATSLEEKLDYLTVQSASALNPAAIGVSPATQRLAVGACRDWFRQAHAEFSRDYRLHIPGTVEAVFQSSHNLGAQTFGLPRWTGAFTTPMDQLERSLSDHWDTHVRPFVAATRARMAHGRGPPGGGAPHPADRLHGHPPGRGPDHHPAGGRDLGAGDRVGPPGGPGAAAVRAERAGPVEGGLPASTARRRSRTRRLRKPVPHRRRRGVGRTGDDRRPGRCGGGELPFEARVVRPTASPTGETS